LVIPENPGKYNFEEVFLRDGSQGHGDGPALSWLDNTLAKI